MNLRHLHLALAFTCAASVFAPGVASAEENPSANPVVTVNGDMISPLELRYALSRGVASFPVARQQAIDRLIDDAPLLQAARPAGAAVPAEVVQTTIDEMVRQQFQGDQAQFEARLQAKGYTLAWYRQHCEATLLAQAMRGQITKGIIDPTARQQALAAWLEKAR